MSRQELFSSVEGIAATVKVYNMVATSKLDKTD